MFIPLTFKNSSSIFLSNEIVGVFITKNIFYKKYKYGIVKLTVWEALRLNTFPGGGVLKCGFTSSQ